MREERTALVLDKDLIYAARYSLDDFIQHTISEVRHKLSHITTIRIFEINNFRCSYTVRVVHNDKSGQRLDEMVPIGFFVCPKDASPMKKAQCKALKQRIRNTVFKNCQLFFDHMQEPINASDEQFVEHVLKQATTVFSNVENIGENNSSVNGRLFFKSAKAGSQNFKYLDFGGGHKYSAAAPFRKTINDELEVSYDNMQRKLMQRLALHLMDEEKASRVSQQKADEEMAEELREIDQNKVALQCWSEQNRRIKEFGTGKVNKVFGKAASAECLEKAMHSQTFMRSFEERHRRYGQQHAKELLDQEQLERVAKLQLIDKMQEQLRQEKQTLVKRILDAEQKRRMSTKDEKVLQEEYSKAKMAKAISHAISHELEQSASQMERKSHRRSHTALLTEEHARRLEDVPLPSQEHINTMQPVLRSIRSEVVHKE